MNTQKVVGKVGKFNIGFRQEQLTSHAGTVLVQDFARRLGVERVLDDVRQGLVSAESAEADYGVVLRDAEVDHAATTKLRAMNRAS